MQLENTLFQTHPLGEFLGDVDKDMAVALEHPYGDRLSISLNPRDSQPLAGRLSEATPPVPSPPNASIPLGEFLGDVNKDMAVARKNPYADRLCIYLNPRGSQPLAGRLSEATPPVPSPPHASIPKGCQIDGTLCPGHLRESMGMHARGD